MILNDKYSNIHCTYYHLNITNFIYYAIITKGNNIVKNANILNSYFSVHNTFYYYYYQINIFVLKKYIYTPITYNIP